MFPIKCFGCGKVIGNKKSKFTEKVQEKKMLKKQINKSYDINKIIYLTKEFDEKTPEGEALDELQINKMCCRIQFITYPNFE